MRIRGLVRASHQVRDQLKTGVPAHQVTQFQQFVQDTLQSVERLCAEAHTCPQQLPTPSRKAYAYLKQVDLSALPIIDATLPPQPQQRVRVQNLRPQQQAIQLKIAQIAQTSQRQDTQIKKLVRLLNDNVGRVEHLCAEQGTTTAALTGQARPLYAWMKFLLEGQNLRRHIDAVGLVQRLVPQVQSGTKSAKGQQRYLSNTLAPLKIAFTNITALYRAQMKQGQTTLKINEGFIIANRDVLTAIVRAVLCGKTTATTTTIDAFSQSEAFNEVRLAMELLVGPIGDQAQGHSYDLAEMFERVNQTYFKGEMERPHLSWSRVHTYRKFGHYEPGRDRVVISLTLDDQRVPPYVVEFVLYHELLHKHHGEVLSKGRRLVHTPAFRHDERLFEQYQLAQDWLDQLAQ